MQLPEILRGNSLVRLLQGAVAGIIAIVIVGFGWGGWTFASTAKKSADAAVNSALVAALAPLCADKFQLAPDAKAKMVALKATDSWKQDAFVDTLPP